MMLNEDKCNYMVFSRSLEPFATRITINGRKLERESQINHLGVNISQDLTWDHHISQVCKKAYSRIQMLTKLKYVGTSTEDLIELYCLHIRSITEYCSSAFHSSLTQKQSNKLETIQKTCLKVILGVMYVEYSAALEMCGLETLHDRRDHKSLQFAIKCVGHPTNKDIFPKNPSTDTHNVRNREHFKVNKTFSEYYRKSTIPYLQGRLNNYFKKLEEVNRRRGAPGRARGEG